ncbi:TetR/AcrR family transcriptional regulator [Amycolatopsis pithecellobii]|uniref:TetR family transcriptional regulator n=1 Tax=Amycolatopsis pithecellobii TaxID=664692 RepID=A0A6N7Z205_9PSEU|nr:TetR/AcrR family transcriptional regulator [Amycolatopsis pithecellobii]MTD53714.1 TetR family transcriptional regulator [Amycolatopsis pithecellobii]
MAVGCSATGEKPRRARKIKEQRKEQLLDALEHLLEKKPLRDLGVEEIAEAAGIARSRFYYKSRHEALAALLRRIADEVLDSYALPDSWFSAVPEGRPRVAQSHFRAHVGSVAEAWRGGS